MPCSAWAVRWTPGWKKSIRGWSTRKKRIREWVVDQNKPFLGFCLGCQLLGDVLGGDVVQSDPPEIGVLDITMTPEAADDALFSDYPDQIKAVQWHSYEVRGLESNPDVTLLGSSDTTRFQIFRYTGSTPTRFSFTSRCAAIP